MTDTSVNAVLHEIEVSATDDPAVLRARADQLMTEWHGAISTIMRLGTEAATLRGRAAAIEARDAAREPLEDAEAECDRALDAFSATADAEAEASARDVEARHFLEQACDAWEAAKTNGAPVAEVVDLDLVAVAAAREGDRAQGLLAQAQQVRADRKRDLDAARVALTRARDALARAEEAISTPLQVPSMSLSERFESLLWTWPLRVSLSSQPGYELDDIDQQLCKELAQHFAGVLDVVPPHLARQIRQETARDVAGEMRKQYQSTEIVLPSGQVTSLGRLGGAIRGPGQG